MNANAPKDYFQAFDLPRRLALNSKALEKEFYRRSRTLHPDLSATKSAEEQADATEQSSLLNDAYRTLKEPFSRSEYLLKLETGTLQEDKPREHGKPKAPPELLEEAFELNMQLEELRMDSTDAMARKEIEASRVKLHGKQQEIEEQLGVLWVRWDAAEATADAAEKSATLAALEKLLDRHRYIRNLVRDVNEALGE